MTFIEVVAQGFGIVGFLINLYGINKSDDRHMKLYVCLSCGFFAIQFYLIGAYMGAFLSIIGGIRYLISGYTKNVYIMAGFITFYIGLAIYNFDNPVDLFLIAGGIIGTYAIFRLEKIPMRYAFLLGCSCNFGYHVYYMAIGSMLNEILNILIHLNVIRRLKKEAK